MQLAFYSWGFTNSLEAKPGKKFLTQFNRKWVDKLLYVKVTPKYIPWTLNIATSKTQSLNTSTHTLPSTNSVAWSSRRITCKVFNVIEPLSTEMVSLGLCPHLLNYLEIYPKFMKIQKILLSLENKTWTGLDILLIRKKF